MNNFHTWKGHLYRQECLTRDRRSKPRCSHCIVSLSKAHVNPWIVLVQPRKTLWTKLKNVKNRIKQRTKKYEYHKVKSAPEILPHIFITSKHSFLW